MHALAVLIEYVRSSPALVATAAGFLTPLGVAELEQARPAKGQGTAVGIVASIVIAGAVALSTGLFDSAKDVFTVLVVLYTASETFYQKLWKQVGLTQKIEAKTSRDLKEPTPASEDTVEGELVTEGE